jgi:hypothetical protein
MAIAQEGLRRDYGAAIGRLMYKDGNCTLSEKARALAAAGIRVLKIREGGISLPPYAHGFIGGASGCFGGTVYFYGDLHTHPDGAAMEDFIGAAGFFAKSLSKEPLIDLGGMLFIE